MRAPSPRLITGCLAAALATTLPVAAQHYEAALLYHGTYPNDEETGYSGEGVDNFQGLTHDADHWFLAMTFGLWKVPVGQDLRHVGDRDELPATILFRHLCDYQGQIPVGLACGTFRVPPDCRALNPITLQPWAPPGFFHVGDLSYFGGYVLAPIEACAPLGHAVVLFRAADLAYVGHASLPREEVPGGDPAYRDLGWVGVDEEGFIYLSGDNTHLIHRYTLDWQAVAQGQVTMTYVETIELVNEDGSQFVDVGNTQGGVFSPSGELFYLLVGIHDTHVSNEGINAFDATATQRPLRWRRIAHSTAADWEDESPPAPFWYHWDPGATTWQEPEGITYWDLDDGRAPGLTGQLHAGMLENDCPCNADCWFCDDDNVSLHNFTNAIHVDPSYSGRETGERHLPFNTLAEGYALAWDRARLVVHPGDYLDVADFSKRIQLVAPTGQVRIGEPPAVSMESGATINVHPGSAMTIR